MSLSTEALKLKRQEELLQASEAKVASLWELRLMSGQNTARGKSTVARLRSSLVSLRPHCAHFLYSSLQSRIILLEQSEDISSGKTSPVINATVGMCQSSWSMLRALGWVRFQASDSFCTGILLASFSACSRKELCCDGNNSCFLPPFARLHFSPQQPSL